ncbi:N-acetylglucosamine kinase [Dyadobacter psychrotolerans]|uniref:N-acetylglucosamine kinase n=1 Tax=Dyadobacter psychrotolerans TaxID=2541721 RepID=A0A4R5DKE1_9BACT|nr:N-acetylglucosamine kinase [Dyadobacter psychrotolerans]TDE12470.1 N-acetylglucosamine kinase [Dyadobacter psychrotolerans]
MNVLIADSGSTKTDWVFRTSEQNIIRFSSAGLNPFYQNEAEISLVINQEVLPNILVDVDKIFFYGAGCADEVSGRPVRNALVSCFPFIKNVEVASDMLGAARGLCGKEPGLACILGTGANNAFYDGKSNIRSIGSLGFWLGDEGSGSYLGKTLVVHFLQNELPEDLHELFALNYPEVNRLAVLDKAYKKSFPNRYFASYSKFIFENITHPFLQKMVTAAFDIFVEKYVLKHQDVHNYPVHFTGSIAYHYKDILELSLTKKGLTIGRILKSPLEGLLLYHDE